MAELLDLAITLTAPPADAPPGTVADFGLSCPTLGLSHSGERLHTLVLPDEREELEWYLEHYWEWPFEGFAERGQKAEALLIQIGERLYDKVFDSKEVDRIMQQWRSKAGDYARQLSIVSEVPGALSLPWELLHDTQGFLVLRPVSPVTIVRRLPQSEQETAKAAFQLPLRVLLVTARPEKVGWIDPRNIARALLDEMQPQIEAGTMALELLRPPTLAALRKRLADTKQPPVHILHFDGHGTFGPSTSATHGLTMEGGEQGKLAFENDEGGLDLVEAEKLGNVLQSSGVRLAMLTACQSAKGDTLTATSSVAARLIQSGLDGVAAMSASVLVASATRYVEAFYRALAAGTAAPVAQEIARQALYDDPRRHVLRRSGDEAGKPIELQDWWLPHFYQQRPLILSAEKSGQSAYTGSKTPSHNDTSAQSGQSAYTGSKTPSHKDNSQLLNPGMPEPPRYGFVGRAHELRQLERWLWQGKLVLIHGFGGVGKTTLTREAADWLTRTNMYAGAYFVSFEHGGDATAFLSELAGYFWQGAPPAEFNPYQPLEAARQLHVWLGSRKFLFIADNLESILPDGEARLEATERNWLWQVLSYLRKQGHGVLLTTRDPNFKDALLAPGKTVKHLHLEGLDPEDAYTLASELLDTLDIPQTRAPYRELNALLAQLDYHPLAIQLVLPNLREISLERIQSDFAALLPKFSDQNEPGRNASLLASLEYSLRRLSQTQRDLLPRLAVFEGGASEDDLLAITEIPADEWQTLRPALEAAALISAEQVHEAIPAPFLRFHPVLAPYLRTLSPTDPTLQSRYLQRYQALAYYLYDEDNRNPIPVRALVQRELPNLRRVLNLLLEAGEVDAASDMADSIIDFLNVFGLGRERDEWRKKLAAVERHKQDGGENELSQAEWLRESGLGEDEFGKGQLQAAYNRFAALLARQEALPPGTPRGQGSYEHCVTLNWLARCLSATKQPVLAEKLLRQAIVLIEALIAQQPDNQNRIRQRGGLLTELGDVLREQGQYGAAQTAYKASLEVADQVRNQAVVLVQLGTLAMLQREYAQANANYQAALVIFQNLAEPESVAVAWHQLGMVAEEQKQWVEAEGYYRQSLAIMEQLGIWSEAAKSRNQLAIVAEGAGRFKEAKVWYKQALALDERVQPDSPSHANHLNNLAALLQKQVQSGRAVIARLAEAKSYAERALQIREKLDASAEIWTTLSILAEIAEMENQPAVARQYRRREREAYAAFAGNRYHIDKQHGKLIAGIAAAAKGDEEWRAAIEAALPQLEANGWKIAAATRRIWAGERDWHALAEGLDAQDALVVLRVLEELGK